MQAIISTPLCPRLLSRAAGLCLLAVGASLGWAQSGVPTTIVKPSSSSSAYELDGVIQAVKQSTVSAQSAGRLDSFVVKAGDKVRAGQLLASIDGREAQVGAQHARAQSQQAEAELRNAQAQLERTRELQTMGFVSKAALDTADAQYRSSLAQRDQANASTRQSEIVQGYTRVTSPLDGWVLQTFAQAGDLAAPGTPLLVIYAPQPLRTVIQVPASRNLALRQAKQTTVLIENAMGATQSITPLNRLEVPSSDPVSQTTEWRMDLATKESAALLPGQQVRVRFALPGTSIAPRLLVPATAVVQRGELSAVYVATTHHFTLRAVRLGRDLGAQGIEVLAGLRAGEVIATDPVRAAQVDTSPAGK